MALVKKGWQRAMLRLIPKVPGSSHSGWFTAEAYCDIYSMVRVTLPNSDLLSVDKKSLVDIGMKPSSPAAAKWPCSASYSSRPSCCAVSPVLSKRILLSCTGKYATKTTII